jgi:hypothetical protein
VLHVGVQIVLGCASYWNDTCCVTRLSNNQRGLGQFLLRRQLLDIDKQVVGAIKQLLLVCPVSFCAIRAIYIYFG